MHFHGHRPGGRDVDHLVEGRKQKFGCVDVSLLLPRGRDRVSPDLTLDFLGRAKLQFGRIHIGQLPVELKTAFSMGPTPTSAPAGSLFKRRLPMRRPISRQSIIPRDRATDNEIL